jgi:F0F1-type ATP synthase assembly protein I
MERKINMEENCNNKASCMQKVMHKIKRSLPELIGMIVGAAFGFFYHKIIGCSTGTCSITSDPWASTIVGGIIGYIIGYFLNKKNK